MPIGNFTHMYWCYKVICCQGKMLKQILLHIIHGLHIFLCSLGIWLYSIYVGPKEDAQSSLDWTYSLSYRCGNSILSSYIDVWVTEFHDPAFYVACFKQLNITYWILFWSAVIKMSQISNCCDPTLHQASCHANENYFCPIHYSHSLTCHFQRK